MVGLVERIDGVASRQSDRFLRAGLIIVPIAVSMSLPMAFGIAMSSGDDGDIVNTHASLLFVLAAVVAIAVCGLAAALLFGSRWQVRKYRVASTGLAAAAVGSGGLTVAVFCAEILSLPFSS